MYSLTIKVRNIPAKVGTTDDDPEYRKFLESYAADNEKMTSTPETLLEEIEAKNRELIGKWAKEIKHYGFFIRRPVRLPLPSFASYVTMG